MPLLPLFPLGTVLLPGARLPLQLFEPRYLELARHLAGRPEDERRFGVLLIRRGHEVGAAAAGDLHGIGCEARVDAMALAEGATGRVVHLVATGLRRFRLEGIAAEAGTPYLSGQVAWLDDAPAATGIPADLLARLRAAEDDYRAALGSDLDPIEASDRLLAYRVAERMVLEPTDRQRVLEATDDIARVRTVLSLLRRETAILRQFGAIPALPDLGPAGLN